MSEKNFRSHIVPLIPTFASAMLWRGTYRIIEFKALGHVPHSPRICKLVLSISASSVETLQRAPVLPRNCIALESGHLKAEVPPTVIDVAMVMHSMARGQLSRNLRVPLSF